jgi:GNAT superfamily N-acetyltransferase
MAVTFGICSSTEDLQSVYDLAVEVSALTPTYTRYEEALAGGEIMVGKDGSNIIAFCIFRQEGDKIVQSYVVVSEDYRQQGIAVALRAVCVAEWASRGATYETSRIPQDSEWLNYQLTERGAILLTTEEHGGVTFNVYRREW